MRTALLLLSLALPAAAGPGDLFDGSGAEKVEFPTYIFTPSAAPKDADAHPAQTKQTGSDLFYFSP
ncbi:MAG: hypothetical protein FD126_3216, partial [Elusimicrobia bacterium]